MVKTVLRRSLMVLGAAFVAPWVPLLVWSLFNRKRDVYELAEELTAGLEQYQHQPLVTDPVSQPAAPALEHVTA